MKYRERPSTLPARVKITLRGSRSRLAALDQAHKGRGSVEGLVAIGFGLRFLQKTPGTAAPEAFRPGAGSGSGTECPFGRGMAGAALLVVRVLRAEVLFIRGPGLTAGGGGMVFFMRFFPQSRRANWAMLFTEEPDHRSANG
jgi:hypothetical protein